MNNQPKSNQLKTGSILKIIGTVSIIVVIAMGFSGCMESKYLKYDDINKIQYAEPTEYAKNFDIEGYISKLPEVKYKKIDYKVKERYTYEFNDYKMTIDIPEGFEVKEIPLKEKPKIVNSTSIEDSYDPESGGRQPKAGPATGDWIHDFSWVRSDSYLCLTNPKFFEAVDSRYLQDDKHKCVISFTPDKSFYKGTSAKDIFIKQFVEQPAKDYKVNNKYGVLFLSTNRTWRNELTDAYMLVNNNQFLVTGVNRNLEDDENVINLFFSILNTVNIQKNK